MPPPTTSTAASHISVMQFMIAELTLDYHRLIRKSEDLALGAYAHVKAIEAAVDVKNRIDALEWAIATAYAASSAPHSR